jgi:hypothetical protein
MADAQTLEDMSPGKERNANPKDGSTRWRT